MECVFLTKQKERKEVTFTKQPLGMTYRSYNNKVLSVKEFGHARECGVEVGWYLVEIDGAVLTKCSKQTKSLLDAAVRRLPSSTDSKNHVEEAFGSDISTQSELDSLSEADEFTDGAGPARDAQKARVQVLKEKLRVQQLQLHVLASDLESTARLGWQADEASALKWRIEHMLDQVEGATCEQLELMSEDWGFQLHVLADNVHLRQQPVLRADSGHSV